MLLTSDNSDDDVTGTLQANGSPDASVALTDSLPCPTGSRPRRNATPKTLFSPGNTPAEAAAKKRKAKVKKSTNPTKRKGLPLATRRSQRRNRRKAQTTLMMMRRRRKSNADQTFTYWRTISWLRHGPMFLRML